MRSIVSQNKPSAIHNSGRLPVLTGQEVGDHRVLDRGYAYFREFTL